MDTFKELSKKHGPVLVLLAMAAGTTLELNGKHYNIKSFGHVKEVKKDA